MAKEIIMGIDYGDHVYDNYGFNEYEVAEYERRTLQTSADGVFMYEAACLEEKNW